MTVTDFYSLAAVFLAALVGLLITIPVTMADRQGSSWLLLVGIIAGGLVGWRRRKSHAFLYFCLVCVIALATLISFQLF